MFITLTPGRVPPIRMSRLGQDSRSRHAAKRVQAWRGRTFRRQRPDSLLRARRSRGFDLEGALALARNELGFESRYEVGRVHFHQCFFAASLGIWLL